MNTKAKKSIKTDRSDCVKINYMDLYLIEEALEGADNTLQFLTGINVDKLSEARTIVRAAIEKAWKIRS